MMQNKKAVVVDLDGTLVQTNTFKDYIIFVAKEAVLNVKPPDFVNAYPKIHQQTMERYVDAVS